MSKLLLSYVSSYVKSRCILNWCEEHSNIFLGYLHIFVLPKWCPLREDFWPKALPEYINTATRISREAKVKGVTNKKRYTWSHVEGTELLDRVNPRVPVLHSSSCLRTRVMLRQEIPGLLERAFSLWCLAWYRCCALDRYMPHWWR